MDVRSLLSNLNAPLGWAVAWIVERPKSALMLWIVSLVVVAVAF